MEIRLAVRRFFCPALGCERKIFAEQVEDLTSRYARKTPLLGSIAVALAGRAASRLVAALTVSACRQVMLKLVMAVPDPQAAPPQVVGVDDFATRRGQHYGTLIIDIETGAPLTSSRAATPNGGYPVGHPALGSGSGQRVSTVQRLGLDPYG